MGRGFYVDMYLYVFEVNGSHLPKWRYIWLNRACISSSIIYFSGLFFDDLSCFIRTRKQRKILPSYSYDTLKPRINSFLTSILCRIDSSLLHVASQSLSDLCTV